MEVALLSLPVICETPLERQRGGTQEANGSNGARVASSTLPAAAAAVPQLTNRERKSERERGRQARRKKRRRLTTLRKN